MPRKRPAPTGPGSSAKLVTAKGFWDATNRNPTNWRDDLDRGLAHRPAVTLGE
jgi:hypothetical protein